MKTCVMCNRPLTHHLSLSFLFSVQPFKQPLVCRKCLDKFTVIDSTTACPGCSRPQTEKAYCVDCLKWKKMYPHLTLNHTALFAYNDMAKEFMDQYKFQGDLLLADVFHEPIREYLISDQKTHLVVPIPLGALSKATRGFNQVELLLKRANIPYKQLLENETMGTLQSSKSRKERLLTLQPYRVINEHELSKNASNKLLVVDDVYTTGRTILHARLLLEHVDGYTVETKSFSLFR